MASTASQAKEQERQMSGRDRIVEAATRLFAERGYAATSTREVAAAAGVSEGLIFKYYPTKRQLLEAVATENNMMSHFISQITASGAGRPVDEVIGEVTTRFVTVLANSPVLSMMIGESRSDPMLHAAFAERIDGAVSALAAYLESRKDHELDQALETRTAAQTLIGSLLLFFLTHDRLPPDEWRAQSADHVRRLQAFWLAAVLPRTPTRPEAETSQPSPDPGARHDH
jgi:AcrR family transcriptional regulator